MDEETGPDQKSEAGIQATQEVKSEGWVSQSLERILVHCAWLSLQSHRLS